MRVDVCRSKRHTGFQSSQETEKCGTIVQSARDSQLTCAKPRVSGAQWRPYPSTACDCRTGKLTESQSVDYIL